MGSGQVQQIKGTVSIDGTVTTQHLDFEVRAGELIAYHGMSTHITIPNSVKIIGKEVFKGCSAISTVVIPDSVVEIRAAAFEGCTDINQIVIPDSVITIGEKIFCGCTSLRKVALSAGITSIPDYAFLDCTNLEDIGLPNFITKIGKYAFKNCVNLQSIILPKRLKTVDIAAFQNCKGLKSFYIPEGTIVNEKFYDNILYEFFRQYDAADSPDAKHLWESLIVSVLNQTPAHVIRKSLRQICFRTETCDRFRHLKGEIREWHTPELQNYIYEGKHIADILNDNRFWKKLIEFSPKYQLNTKTNKFEHTEYHDLDGGDYWDTWIIALPHEKILFAQGDCIMFQESGIIVLEFSIPELSILKKWYDNYKQKKCFAGGSISFWSGKCEICNNYCKANNPNCPLSL